VKAAKKINKKTRKVACGDQFNLDLETDSDHRFEKCEGIFGWKQEKTKKKGKTFPSTRSFVRSFIGSCHRLGLGFSISM
jgi:hypothetical protein